MNFNKIRTEALSIFVYNRYHISYSLLFQGNLKFLMKRKGVHKYKIDFMVCFRSTGMTYDTFLESLLPCQFIETIKMVPDQPQDDQEAQEHHQYIFFLGFS